jgi:hypothetical protein
LSRVVLQDRARLNCGNVPGRTFGFFLSQGGKLWERNALPVPSTRPGPARSFLPSYDGWSLNERCFREGQHLSAAKGGADRLAEQRQVAVLEGNLSGTIAIQTL